MAQQPPLDGNLLISYLALRKAIGVIGIALPFALAVGVMVASGFGLAAPDIEMSISAYYHTVMRDVLVGSMCAIGVFLMSYRGYDRDHIAGILGGLFAVGVALCPTSRYADPVGCEHVLSVLHAVFAGLLFATLAYFSLVLFTKTSGDAAPTARKRHRNIVYRVCGIVIVLCILLVGLVSLLFSDVPSVLAHHPVFWLEAIAIVAFGVSWLVKGEAILRDRSESRSK